MAHAQTSLTITTQDNQTLHFNVELAQTPQEQKTGMMFRENIPENTGMLFIFEQEEPRNFWMKNTPSALDILFIRANGRIHHIQHMTKPYSLDFISSNGAVKNVLEIAGGTAKQKNISIGDLITYNKAGDKK